MKFKWRKWNRAIHRDFGYFFFGMTLIYAISGIAINHIGDWNPNYVIKTKDIKLQESTDLRNLSDDEIKSILADYGVDNLYTKHYYPSSGNSVKIFLRGGSASIDLDSKTGIIEMVKKRKVFNEVNFLHYNPGKWWTLFSDIFAGALMLLAITGLFILKGKNGITGRGAWLSILGLIIPILFLIFLR